MSCLTSAVTAAHAAPVHTKSLYAPSALVLSVGDGEDAASASVRRAVTLSCNPTPTGSHPAAADACAELRAVGGDFGRLRTTEGPGRICTKNWKPVVVSAEGIWDGHRVRYEHTYPNDCVRDGAMTHVFGF